MADFRDDQIYINHLVNNSRKRRNIKVSADMYKAPTVNAPWIDAGGRVFTIDGSQVANASLVFSSLLIAPSNYRVKFTISSYVAGNLFLNNADFQSDNFLANGSYEIDVSTFADVDFNVTADVDFNGSVLIESVKRIV
tara:strand:- start:402 stop:815 length:414 start_codon:yes stop_codon:yes gene_type:complete